MIGVFAPSLWISLVWRELSVTKIYRDDKMRPLREIHLLKLIFVISLLKLFISEAAFRRLSHYVKKQNV